MSEKSADELRELSLKILENPQEVDNLSLEEAVQLTRYLHPYGNIIAAQKKYANLSVINWRESYMQKLTMTALIGFMFQLCEEEPEPGREVIRAFLKRNLEFDVNRHVSAAKFDAAALAADTLGAGKTVDTLPESAQSTSIAGQEEATGKAFDQSNIFDPLFLRRVSVLVVDCLSEMDMYLNKILVPLTVKSNAIILGTEEGDTRGIATAFPKAEQRDIATNLAWAISELRASARDGFSWMDPKQEKNDALHDAFMKSYQILAAGVPRIKNFACGLDPEIQACASALESCARDLGKLVEPISRAETRTAAAANPPAELFHNFHRYLENNYERLRQIVETAFAERPDIDFSVIFYDAFDTEEDAREHRLKYADEFRAGVFTVENGGITMLGPFKENRDRVDFYNRNTELLKRLTEQMEKDHKLGKDLMEKQIKTKKRANLAATGPDAAGLSNYVKAVNTVRELGAKEGMTKEEKDKFFAARQLKETNEVPEGAIQTEIYHPVQGPNGEQVLERSLMYTQAEAPLHLMPNSPYATEYQPKKIQSRTGEVTTTAELAKRK